MARISFRECHKIKCGTLRFEASSRETAVIIYPCFHHVFLSIPYLLRFSGATSIKSSYSGKFWLSFAVVQKFRFSHLSSHLANIRFVSTRSILTPPVSFSFTVYISLNEATRSTGAFFAFCSEQTSVNRTLMGTFGEVMEMTSFLVG